MTVNVIEENENMKPESQTKHDGT